MAVLAIAGAPQERSTQDLMHESVRLVKAKLLIDPATDLNQENNYDELRQKEKTRTRP